jgi:glycosyltransferase involved in cell wall biosynthesis
MISIIVFAYNEVKYIEPTLIEIMDAVSKIGSENFELIVIDDGSTDGTSIEINRFKQNYSQLKFLRNSSKSGILFSIKKGLDISSGDQILCIPGHYMFDSSQISKILCAAKNYKVVIGYRENKRDERPFPKLIASWALLNLFRVFVDSNMIDIHGLNIFPRKVLAEAINEQDGHGNHIIPIAKSLKLGLTIVHIPVRIRKGHKSRLGRGIRTEIPSFSGALSVLKQVYIARRTLR